MSIRVVRLCFLLVAFVIGATAFCFEVPVGAGTPGQNANSAVTEEPQNANVAKPTRRGRRGRRAPKPVADSTMDTAAESPTMASAVTQPADLSGTYVGAFDCSDAGLTGDTTLTITGNQFTISDGRSGRIVGSTTHGYTAVALQMGESVAGSGGQPGSVPTIVSMRAKKSGDRLTLMAVPGSGHTCSFTPVIATRARRARAATPAEPATPAAPMIAPATPATPATPAAPAAAAGPMPPASPTPRGRRGRRSTRTPNSNSNTNTNSNKSSNDNTGEGTPNPKATPKPPVRR